MREHAVQDESKDLHIAVGMGRKSGAGTDAVFIDDPQAAKSQIARIVVVAE
jgi:hypothetical protein